MKKQLLIAAMLISSLTLAAQSQSLGVQLGFSEPILRDNTSSKSSKLDNTTTTDGFKVGLVYDATLIKGFGLSVGLNYLFAADAGSWQNINDLNKAKLIKTTTTQHFIELPIDWQYKFQIAYNTYIILYSGPTIQYNIAFNNDTYIHDKIKNTKTHDSSENHYEINLDKYDKTDYSHFNLQWGIGAGFQYKNYYIRGGYNFGIYNHFKDSYNNLLEYDNRARYDEWHIRLGIYFLNF